MKKPLFPSFTSGLSKAAFWLLIVYFTSATLLSAFILLRLQVLPTIWVKYSNTGLYFLNYHIFTFLAFVWLLAPFFSSRQQSKIRQLQLSMSFGFLLAALYFTLLFVTILGIVPEYIVLPIPMILVFLIYMIKFKPQKRFSKKAIAPVLAIIMVFSILLPHLTALGCYNNILSQASTISNPEEKATFISQYVYYITAFAPFLKSILEQTVTFENIFWLA